MNIKAVIFDMDGVIVDSEKVITKSCIMALKNWNIACKKDDFKPFTGMGEDAFIGGVANKYGIAYDLAMKKLAYEIYIDIVDKEITLYDGVSELIDYLKKKGYKLALASSADMIKVKANLNAANIPLKVFDSLQCGNMVKNKKPAPDIFLQAAKAINVKEDQCIVIEDALSGIIAAKAANMYSVAVLSSFSKNDFIPLSPNYIINNTVELKNIL